MDQFSMKWYCVLTENEHRFANFLMVARMRRLVIVRWQLFNFVSNLV